MDMLERAQKVREVMERIDRLVLARRLDEIGWKYFFDELRVLQLELDEALNGKSKQTQAN